MLTLMDLDCCGTSKMKILKYLDAWGKDFYFKLLLFKY